MNKKKKILAVLLGGVLVGVLAILSVFIILFGPVLKEALFDRPAKPKVTYGEFPFELVYEYDNQKYTVNETIVCEYEGISFSLDGGNSREWNCYITNNDESGRYHLDSDKYRALYVQVPLEADYYMGDPAFNAEFAMPYIYFIDDNTGTVYYEQDLMDVVGAKIISWNVSSPLENNFNQR